MIIIAAFYHFFDFPDFESRKHPLREEMLAQSIRGSLLIAPEGINGTIAGPREGIDRFLHYLRTQIVGGELEHKESRSDTQPFARAKVRLKKETISLGLEVDLRHTGTYVAPADWNALISDPDTILLDTRNDYEVHMGTFRGAVNPDIATFKQLPAFVRKTLAERKHARIATFCTGGIRCEKFTAWMKEEGFTDVYHLKGGILKYLEEIPASQSLWEGECYVFDDRIAVTHGVRPSETAGQCYRCGYPLTPEDRTHPDYIPGGTCPYCAGATP